MNEQEPGGGVRGLLVLARALAYVVDADSKTTLEEKAKMLTVMGKHVARGEITPHQLKGLTDDAFNHAAMVPVERFIDDIVEGLTPAQKVSLVINLYDTMLVDGQVATGERTVIDKFVGAFEISRNTIRALREVLMLKNDTGLFTDPNHPFNEPSFRLDLQLIGAFEAEAPPELKYKPRDEKK
jgi:uncharacterized tellurite resistance protein B-like protein